ncbi:response regulator [Lentzea jiangxiensis]|uniref:DNA-binding response regulator, NarL/FixJ family, contains REC and HTH domains n=1 Tax=Lentzea jiangxiensis TaxID=641025 RepID=A0A1H0X7C5_9PSEU|nr:response regulator transcription factor [Lentzea jiangxiensis]SDP98843.1 DNA-binding response regulator, NarL/FixJ family, contains REC and HTH domains [Lentzea jiangxiensis]
MEDEKDSRIKVFLVDDHSVVRKGMRVFLDQIEDVLVVGEAVDGQEAVDALAIAALEDRLPDVVLMDLMMPRLDGIGATRVIKQKHPEVQVVALTSFSETERVHLVLEAGASGYLLKDAEADEVVAAVRAAWRGQVHLHAEVAKRLTRSYVKQQDHKSSLTTREREILVLIAGGRSNQEIADELSISERTARTHVSNVLAKLHLTSRTQAALWAVKEGLVIAQ